MAPLLPRETRASATRADARDPFAAQLRLSRVHTRLVPMQRSGAGYVIDPAAQDWFELPASRGFAGYGLGRALGLLLDAMRGLSALNETVTASGEPFAHGELTPLQFRVDPLGVCRLVPLTTRHYISEDAAPPPAALGFLSPERLIGEKVGVRADVFSAGVLLWEALAGRRMTETGSAEVIVERLMSQRLRVPPLPPQLAWAAPLKVEVERALSINEKRRFADCAELSAVILRVAQDRVASQTEIAEFFASNFKTAPSPEPSSAPGSVSRERLIANPGATFRMLPAINPPRHATLKMNVTLRMAQVPVPIAREAAPAAAAQLPPSIPRAPTDPALFRPTPPPLLRPSSPPLGLSSLLLRRSLTPSPAARSTPPPLPTSEPPTLPAPPLSSLPPSAELLPAHGAQRPSQPPQSPPPLLPSLPQELGSGTPVPTQLSFLQPAHPPSLPPTTTDRISEPPHARSRRRPALILAIVAGLMIGALVGARYFIAQGAHGSTAPTRLPLARGVSLPATIASSTPRPISSCCTETPSLGARNDDLSRRDAVQPSAASRGTDVFQKVERSIGASTPTRQPQTRPAPGVALPNGKDYGI